MTDEQKVAIKKAAAEARLSISDYCVKMIFQGKINLPFSAEESQLILSLTGMANNLNQAMKKVHQQGSDERMDELNNIISAINKLLK